VNSGAARTGFIGNGPMDSAHQAAQSARFSLRHHEALNAPETVAEAAEILCGLIDGIVLTPVDGILRAELDGDLAVLARFAQAGKHNRAGPCGNPARLSLVAGVRFIQERTNHTVRKRV
jgi:hypothetical protein